MAQTIESESPIQPHVTTADDYRAPDWLRYPRAVCFDGYSPPLYPDIKKFDARRLIQRVAELGADTFSRAYPPLRAGAVRRCFITRCLTAVVAGRLRDVEDLLASGGQLQASGHGSVDKLLSQT